GVSLVGALIVRWTDRSFRIQDLWLLAVFLLFLAFGAAQSLESTNYMMSAFHNLPFKPVKLAAAVFTLTFVVFISAYWIRKHRWFENQWFIRVVVGILIPFLLFVYFARPYYPRSNIGSPNAEAFVALGWYFTDPIVVLALIGFVLYAARIRSINWIF